MFTSNLCVEFNAASKKLLENTHEVYDGHSFYAGYMQSLSRQMFESLSPAKQKQFLVSIQKSADEYEKKCSTRKIQNYFPTLNEALESEDLIEAWDMNKSSINYGETYSWTWGDGGSWSFCLSVPQYRGFL